MREKKQERKKEERKEKRAGFAVAFALLVGRKQKKWENKLKTTQNQTKREKLLNAAQEKTNWKTRPPVPNGTLVLR